jgi:hypothetical protein
MYLHNSSLLAGWYCEKLTTENSEVAELTEKEVKI